MRRGSRGNEVMELQEKLKSAGFNPGPIDGVYGPSTEKAVRDFQYEYGLAVDGIAGPNTVGELDEVLDMKPYKSQNEQLTPNFNEKEFACKHCGYILINPLLLSKLQRMREELGVPIRVTSGYRCPTHNRQVGGATRSYHLLGQAADIVVQGKSPSEIASLANRLGFGGIGIYNKSGFTHVDVGPDRRWSE